MVNPITQNYNVDIKIWSEVWNEKKYEMKKTYKYIPLRFRELIKFYIGFISDKCPENCEYQRYWSDECILNR